MSRSRSTERSVLAFLTMLVLSFAAPSLRAELLLFYSFDKVPDPQIAVDYSGKGNHGTVNGYTPAQYTDPGRGRTETEEDRALDFLTTADGTWLDVPSAATGAFDSITTNDAATITMWIYGGPNQPVNQWNFWFGPGRQIASHVPWSDGTIYFDVAGCCGATQRINRNEPDPTHYKGQWNHYAFVKQQETTRVYQNGALFVEGLGKAPLGAITEVFFGAGDSTHGNNYNGLIDEIGVWDEALTEEQIQIVMAEGVPPPEALIFFLKRDIPDTLVNGASGVVTLTVFPVIGSGVVVVNETLPPGFTAANPSMGGVVAGDTITWNLGKVDTQTVLSYTMTVPQETADVIIDSTATVDGAPIPLTGDLAYTGSPFTINGFIKLWSHLGPLAWQYPVASNDHGDNGVPGACSALEPDPQDPFLTVSVLPRDWIVNEGETITEANILPFPGMLVRPKYGGDGILPGGTGARAAGLTVGPQDGGLVVRDRYPVWKGVLTRGDTIDHADPSIDGMDDDDAMHMSCVYVQNHSGGPIDTMVGYGSDDSIQILLGTEQNMVDVTQGGLNICRGWGGPNEEQSISQVTIPEGESRLLVKVTDGYGGAGFRLRFQDPLSPDPLFPLGLVPPRITVSLQSARNPRPGSAVRTFAKTSFGLGEPIDVSIAVSLNAAADVTVLEALPAFTTASAISPGGSVVGNTIQWSLTNVSTRSVSYKLTPATCVGDLTYRTSSIKVGSNEVAIEGPSALTRAYPDEPLGVWSSQDLVVTGGGAQKLGTHEVFVNGTGAGIKSQKDELRFISIPQNGDFELSARIDCLESTSTSGGQAGLMVRDSILPNAATLFFAVSTAPPTAPAVGVASLKARARRDVDKFALDVALTDAAVTSLPVYLKMVRTSTPAPEIQLFRSSDGVSWGIPIGSKTIGLATSDVNLKADTLIGLGVTGNVGATRAAFSQVSGPPFTSPPPGAPSGLVATGGTKQISLIWNAPVGEPAAATYTIHRGAKGGPYTNVGEVPATQTTFTNTGLPDNTEFCYVVKSKAGAESGPSNEACARTQSGVVEVKFKRGDADGDGAINLTDPIFTLANQFQGGPPPPCMDAADADDQGDYNLTDAIFSLQWQFLAGATPPLPGPNACGPDPTADNFAAADCKDPQHACQ